MDDKNKLSGWYYDLQTDYTGPGRMTCITLHPSTKKPKDENSVKWEKYEGPGDEDDVKKFYRKKPIAIALMGEDFQVSIANSWSDFGGDMIGQMWDSLRPLAPYAGYAEEMIGKMVSNYKEADSKGLIKENSLSKAIGGAVEKAWNYYKEHTQNGGVSDYLSMALVCMGTRFSYYSGTGISFGNMVMKYYVMPKWENGKLITVNEQLEDLYPYIVGHLMLEKNEKGENKPDQLIAWQQAPGGFKSDYRDIDTKQEGTLLMKFGGLYSVNNLVVESANLVFSKQAIKQPVVSEKLKQAYSPLFCEVTLQLRPASKFSDDRLKDFVNNAASLAKTHEEISKRILR